MKRPYLIKIIALLVIFMSTTVHAFDITLAWDRNVELDIVRYNLYVRVNGSGPYNLVDEITLDKIDPANPQFSVSDMENNITYNFVVTAINDSELESHFSNEVSVINGQAIVPAVSSGSSGGGGGCFISTSSCESLIK